MCDVDLGSLKTISPEFFVALIALLHHVFDAINQKFLHYHLDPFDWQAVQFLVGVFELLGVKNLVAT